VLIYDDILKEQYPKTDISNLHAKKVIRDLENEATAQTIIDAFRIYYNFIKPHQALNGKTPAET
jgi:transposase InsO family protein